MTRQFPRRPAFSLLELLVVIALLSVLAALAAGTYFRIRNTQQSNSTESTLKKLSVGLKNLWTAERDRADKEFTNGQIRGGSMAGLMGFCGSNEKNRARAVWLYLRLKSEFPQTFPEALSGTALIGPSGTVLQIPAKDTFRNVVGYSPANADEANLQSAALLYLILTEKSSTGVAFDSDALNAFTKTVEIGDLNSGIKEYRVFVDSWGTPITYVRFFTSPELNTPSYATHNGPMAFAVLGPSTPLPSGISNNPFDSKGRLTNVGWANFSPYFISSAGIFPFPPGTTDLRRYDSLLRSNFFPTVISAGVNRKWDGLDVRGFATNPKNIGITPYNVVNGVPTTVSDDDNVFGFRLTRFGVRGD